MKKEINKEGILKFIGYATILSLFFSIYEHIHEVFFYSSGRFLISIHISITLIVLWIGFYLMIIKDYLYNQIQK